MQENLEAIKAFIEQIRKYVPGDVKRITAAIGDGALDFDAWDNGDDTLWNVVIGDRGSATFTISEAKKPTDEVIKRVVKELLGLSPQEKAAQQQLVQADAQLATFPQRRSQLDAKATQARDQLADKRAALETETARIEAQIVAAQQGLTVEEAGLKAYRDALAQIAAGETDGVITL